LLYQDWCGSCNYTLYKKLEEESIMKKDTEEEKVGSSGCPLFMAWVGLFVATLFCFLLLRIFPSLEPEEVVWYPFKKWWVLLIVGIFLGGYVGILIERKLPKSKSKD
tara:strand:- start:272 stop:592 length:321 start_codon:yes stop_codon:yes gene_type:complete